MILNKRINLLMLLFFIFMISGCYKIDDEIDGDAENAARPCAMVNNIRYFDTGIAADSEFDFEVDGILTSNVSGTKLPTKNNQSNLVSVGYEYDIISDDILYVHIGEEWIIYESYKGD